MLGNDLMLFNTKKGINFSKTHTLTVGHLLDDSISSSDEYGFCREADLKGAVVATAGSISPNTFNSLYISDLCAVTVTIENSTGFPYLIAHISSLQNSVLFSDDIGDIRIAFSNSLSFIGKFGVTVSSTGAGNYTYTAEVGSNEELWNYLKNNNGKQVPVMIELVKGGVVNLLRRFFSQLFRKEVLV